MLDLKNKFRNVKKAYLQIAGLVLLILLALSLLWFNNSNSRQAMPALVADVYFDGEYSIDGGEWREIVKGEHIPSTKGDVLLRGNFHMLAPDGEYVGIYRGDLPIAFYTDHINLAFYEGDCLTFVADIENPLYSPSDCGVSWVAYTPMSDPEQDIEILIHNPHIFGNENAIDEMLSNVAFWGNIDF